MRWVRSAILALVAWPMVCQAQGFEVGSLPPPLATENSLEICLNSRYSQHSLNRTPASAQQISNILWAAGRVPVTGAYRTIYIATPTGTYLYDPATHSTSLHSDEATNDGAFALIYEAERDFDTGASFMPAMLASVSLGNSSESTMASCPKGLGYPTTRLIFGVQAVKGLTHELTARCSVHEGQPGWLPAPLTAGDNSFEGVLANLNYTSTFAQTDLTLPQVSQILWAGYGCTAHMTTNGRAGLTVPSAFANYYLTGSIYLVNGSGVYRYHNRNPSTNTATRDHRIEDIRSAVSVRPRPPSAGDDEDAVDPRVTLRSALEGLPVAPCYVILCLDFSYAGQHYAQLETGFVAGNMLMQATAIGMGCHFEPDLTTAERAGIHSATRIPVSHVPQAVVSIGPPAALVSVSVGLQGEGRPDAGWAIPLTVRFFAPGADATSAPAYEFELITARSPDGNSAVCTASGVAPGVYDIAVVGGSTLASLKRNVVVSLPATSVDLGTLLEGNLNRDGAIDLGDYAILSRHWLLSESQAEYDAQADCDRNGLVDAADLALLAANWLWTSPVEIGP